jgi:hypothetical protein
MQRVSLRYAEIASQQVSGDDRGFADWTLISVRFGGLRREGFRRPVLQTALWLRHVQRCW